MKLKVVVDTNIIFSAILKPDSRIGKIIITSKKHFQFYTCDYLKVELLKHRNKLLKLTMLLPEHLDELEFLLTKNIIFINENLIPEKIIIESENILREVDLNDTAFVALAKHMKARLWTGDKRLISGIEEKEFIETLTTNQLSELLDRQERR